VIRCSWFVFLFLYVIPVTAATWNREVGVHWSAVPLGESLERFAEAQKIGVFLDRRVDPSQSIEFEAVRRPLGIFFDELAVSLDLGCCRFDSVAYIGPKSAAEALAARQPPTRAALRRRVPLEIPFLSTPKEILEQLAKDNGLRWHNLDRLPHDLLLQRKLPPTPLFQLFDLLLIGFDKTFEIEEDGKTLRIIPLQQKTAMSTTVSPQEDSKPPSSAVPLARRRFTLTIKDQELGDVLRSLAERIGFTLEVDEESLTEKNVTLRQRVSFEARNAAAPELFRGILSPLKLEFTIHGETLRVR
jgi:hypothetical protein